MTGTENAPNSDDMVDIGEEHHKAGRPQEAESYYRKALDIDPGHPGALYFLASIAYDDGRLTLATQLTEKLLRDEPNDVEAWHLLGMIAHKEERFPRAVECFKTSVAIQPAYLQGHYSLGAALNTLRRLDEALVCFDKIVALKPDSAEAHSNRGSALVALKRWGEALTCYDQTIALNPDLAAAHFNRGAVLKVLQRYDEAIVSYSKAMALNPDSEFLLGDLLHAKIISCDWQNLIENLKRYETDILSSKKTTRPFPALALLDSPECHKQAARIYADARAPKLEKLGAIKKRARNKRIRLGYYSSDFRNHPVAYLIAELFESHNTQRFELFGFYFGPNTMDEMHMRVSSAFDHFFDVRGKSDLEITQQSRELGIDIAIDLNGVTKGSRMGIFAARCAPIQVNYLGYPGTMGAEYIDYIIADATVIPYEQQGNYSEKVVYLPHSFQVNDSKRKRSNGVLTKSQLGLLDSGFVFCCFNSTYKIQPSTFDVWMRIIKAVEGSVLWLVDENPTVIKNLQKEAECRGVDSNRLIFARRMAYGDYLACYKWADLFLDTLPYNAGTTASDALWAGLPVLTCMGKSFAGRMAASLLNAIELPELITSTEAEYKARAIELASDPGKLAEIKLKLENKKNTSPLFDTNLFTRHIELAYETMYGRYQSGLAPDNIEIKAYT